MKRSLLAALLALTGCAYGGPAGDYSVSGTVRGVSGQGVFLSDANGAGVFVSSDGSFIIEDAYADGGAYQVTAEGDPSGPATKCVVANGSGVIRAADVDGVSIVCTPSTFTVSGTVSGLTTWGLVLEANGEEIALAKDGTFTFFVPVTSGSTYSVQIAQEPEGQASALENAVGTVAARDITDVTVSCTSLDPAPSPERLD